MERKKRNRLIKHQNKKHHQTFKQKMIKVVCVKCYFLLTVKANILNKNWF